MTQSFLRYKPQDGYIHHWLVAGPQIIPIANESSLPKLDSQQLAADFGQDGSGISDAPLENAKFTPLGAPDIGQQFTWRYRRCEDDHLVDWAASYPPHHSLRAWAYTELVSPVAQHVCLTLHVFGPAQCWLNGQRVMHQEHWGVEPLHKVTSEVQLVKGANQLLVRLEQVADGPTPFAFALKVSDSSPHRLQVHLPTPNPDVKKHYAVERLAQQAYLERDLYAGAEAIFVKWPATIRATRPLMLRVQKPSGGIVGEAQPIISAGLSQHILEGSWAKDGRYQVKVLPELEDHVRGLRVEQDLDVNILHSTYVHEAQGDQSTRAVEFLKHAAWWTDGLYAEMASMALGHWKQVNEKAVLRVMDQTLARHEGCYENLIGLLLMVNRYAQDPSMSQELAQRLEACLLGFDYEAAAVGEQGLDDDIAIVRHACSVLAGQLYAERPFVCSGKPGRWHQELGEQRSLAWLARRAQGGFAAWDSGEGFVAMLLGLVALADSADSEALSDLAAAMVDKILFSLALNSFQGIFGSTHGATSAASITDARMEPTSPVSLLLWGVGCWNQHTAAAFALATSQNYGCPPLHALIALERPAALLSRERHVTAWRDSDQGPAADQEVNKVTYKTPDYMLSSAQDYRPGEMGGSEHIWQATMGPDAAVFVTHPRCMNQKDAYRPNFWRGNSVLPRVAQWQDVLIALHRLPADDWLGYTHAHFPIAAFDQVALRRGWAFARKGDAYLALTASMGMKLVKRGPGAFRELRSVAQHNVWLCQMGRAAQDGTFADFQKAILSRPPTFGDLSVSYRSLRGETVVFDWEGPLLVDNTAQPLDSALHYESPYAQCALGATQMDIHFADWMLRLNLEPSSELLPDALPETQGG